MKSEIITVTSQGIGINDALTMTEQSAKEQGLEKKPMLHLRLLAEELFGMLRSIVGEVEADFWIEAEDKRFELHMNSNMDLTREMRQQLLSASTSGANAAAKGVMGKIRDMIATALLPREAGPSMLSFGLMAMGSPGGYRAGNYVWSMKDYKEGVAQKEPGDSEAAAAWDELEKSIVANIADDVIVGIKGSDVSLTVYKSFQ